MIFIQAIPWIRKCQRRARRGCGAPIAAGPLLEPLEPRVLMSVVYDLPGLWPDGAAMEAITTGLTTSASSVPIFLSGGAAPSAVSTTPGGVVMNLDDFRADPRFTGIDGSGFASVIIDTGIDLNHPYFGPDADANGVADRIVYHYDFFGANDPDGSDKQGHGSNVASIVGSSNTTYSGVAPASNIIALKVFPDGSGSGNFGDIEEALNWVVNNAAAYNVASVNMSLGDENNFTTPQTLYGIADELSALSTLGVIVAAAAGNAFYTKGSQVGVAYPAADPNALAVSAVYTSNIGSVTYGDGAKANTTAADRVTPFSQRHATLTDIFAPGAPITGANATGGTVTMHGTSQASPHVAGVALLMQELAVQELGRRLTPGEFLSLMRSSATTINDGDDENDNVTNTGLNFPRLDVLAMGNAVLGLAGPRSGISGTVFNDADIDGVRDGGEAGLPGWNVYLDLNNNAQLDTIHITPASSDVPMDIPILGQSTITSRLTVSGLTMPILDVNVTLDITHPDDGTLDAFLIAPDGTRVELFTAVGGSGDNFTDTTLDDQAAASIADGAAPFTGIFRPEGLLSVLNGLDGNGEWTLEVTDIFELEGGSLNSWSLDLRTAEPSRVTDSLGGYTFTGLVGGIYNIRTVAQTGWSQTNPPGGGAHVVTVPNSQTISNVEFGQSQGGGLSLLYAEDFNDGVANGFAAGAGSWTVSGGRYHANPVTSGASPVTTVAVASLPANFTVEALVNGDPPSASFASTNALIVFDYIDSSNYKFAGLFIGVDQFRMGQVVGGTRSDLAIVAYDLSHGTDYTPRLSVSGKTASLAMGWQSNLISYTYADALNDGRVGVGAINAKSHFDDFRVFAPPAPPGPLYVEDFNDGVANGFTAGAGSWTVSGGRYHATPTSSGGSTVATIGVASLPSGFTVDAMVNSDAPGGAYTSTNALIVFDYVNSTNYKFAGLFIGVDQLRIGRVVQGQRQDLATVGYDLSPGIDYALKLTISGMTASLAVGGPGNLVSYTYGDALNDGRVGVGTITARSHFDNFVVNTADQTGGAGTGSVESSTDSPSQPAAKRRPPTQGLSAWLNAFDTTPNDSVDLIRSARPRRVGVAHRL